MSNCSWKNPLFFFKFKVTLKVLMSKLLQNINIIFSIFERKKIPLLGSNRGPRHFNRRQAFSADSKHFLSHSRPRWWSSWDRRCVTSTTSASTASPTSSASPERSSRRRPPTRNFSARSLRLCSGRRPSPASSEDQPRPGAGKFGRPPQICFGIYWIPRCISLFVW